MEAATRRRGGDRSRGDRGGGLGWDRTPFKDAEYGFTMPAGNGDAR